MFAFQVRVSAWRSWRFGGSLFRVDEVARPVASTSGFVSMELCVVFVLNRHVAKSARNLSWWGLRVGCPTEVGTR